MDKQYLSILEVAQLLSVSEDWIYKKSKSLDYAKVKLNGKAMQPTRFDRERLALLLSGSVTSRGNSDLRRKVGRV